MQEELEQRAPPAPSGGTAPWGASPEPRTPAPPPAVPAAPCRGASEPGPTGEPPPSPGSGTRQIAKRAAASGGGPGAVRPAPRVRTAGTAAGGKRDRERSLGPTA